MNIGTKLLSKIDYSSTLAPKNQVFALVVGTFAARALASRSKEELRETLTRDCTTLVVLFYLASIVENSIGYILDKMSPACQKGMSLIKGPEGKSFLKMLNPLGGKHKVRSFEDIEAIAKQIKPENLKDLMRNKSIVNVIGLLSSIAALGIFVPWLNVQITRKKVLEEQEQKAAAARLASSRANLASNSAKPISPTINFAPTATSFNHLG